MQAFQYDENGYYSKTVDCQIDPRASVLAGKTVYLLPGSATFAEPLPEKPGYKVKFNGSAWEYEEIPPLPEPTPEELKQAEIWELKGKLAASDYAVIKIAEGAATAEEYADLIKSRQEWRARINELGADMRVLIALIAGYLGYRLVKKGYDMTQPQDIYMAKTIWGEARGEGARGMQAVANVIMNRVNRGGWYGASIKDVVLKPYQFSCWNATDPNRAKIDALTEADLAASGALNIARQVISGQLPDITGGATEYHNKKITPSWNWDKLEKTVTIGNHVFYRSK